MSTSLRTMQQPATGAESVEPPPRVLVVIPQPFYSDRGSPIALRQVVDAYLDLGRDVDVVTFSLGEDFEHEGLRFFRAANPLCIRSVPIGFSLRKLLLDVTLTLELQSRLRTGSYELVHALEESAFPAVWLARARGLPVLYDMHSQLSEGLKRVPGLRRGPLRWLVRRLERWLVRNADTVVASKGLASEVRRIDPRARVFEWQFPGTLGAPSGPTPEEIRSGLDIAPESPIVLYSGSFAEYQGLDLLLDAAAVATTRVPDATFVLVGSAPEEESAVRKQLARLGIERRVRIVPRQPRSSIHAYFAAADLLVSPRTSGENVPLKVFDYLAADRPVVATDTPTHRTVLNDRNALLAAPDAAALGAAIARVIEEPELANRLRKGAAEYAHARLGWPAFVESLTDIHQVVTESS